MKKIILASSSPRRKEILSKAGLDFKIIVSDYEENLNLNLSPKELAKHLSKEKAKNVAKKCKNSVIIGADTFVVLGNDLLGKPRNKETAKKMLKRVSGQTVDILTGFTIMDSDSKKSTSKAVRTKVYINNLSEEEIKNYVATGEPLDKAGAFAIQELGAVFIKKIEGDFFNVMGLPLYKLCEELKKFEITIL